MKEKATIYNYARMCKFYDNCSICPLGETNCPLLISENSDKANEIILKWCKEHPIKTRQSEFLEMFPNAWLDDNKMLDLCPKSVDKNYTHKNQQCIDTDCDDCKKDYWLAEVEENDK